MRLIDADELRERYSGDEFYSAAHIREAIDGSPAASPWHRVEDELPAYGRIVTACNWCGTVRAAYLSGNGKWYEANNSQYDAWTWMPNVTHWMPLPKPPKIEGDA